jgi:hypothetical protein
MEARRRLGKTNSRSRMKKAPAGNRGQSQTSVQSSEWGSGALAMMVSVSVGNECIVCAIAQFGIGESTESLRSVRTFPQIPR